MKTTDTAQTIYTAFIAAQARLADMRAAAPRLVLGGDNSERLALAPMIAAQEAEVEDLRIRTIRAAGH